MPLLEKNKTNDLSFQLKLEKQQQIKPKVSIRGKKRIKMAIKQRKRKRINEYKTGSLCKHDKPLVRFARKKREDAS